MRRRRKVWAGCPIQPGVKRCSTVMMRDASCLLDAQRSDLGRVNVQRICPYFIHWLFGLPTVINQTYRRAAAYIITNDRQSLHLLATKHYSNSSVLRSHEQGGELPHHLHRWSAF
jgi:hypothetical protein